MAKTKKANAAARKDRGLWSALKPGAANFTALTPVAFLPRAAEIYPDRVAVIHGATRFTYAQFHERALRLASALAKKGVKAGDVVSAMLPNVPAMLEAHYGVPMLGAVLNTINTRLDADTVAYILEHGEAKVLITDRVFSGVVGPALKKLKRKPIVIDVDDPLYTGPGERLGRIEYEAFLKTGRPDFAWSPPRDESAPIALNYTSGTTGRPKGVPRRHRAERMAALAHVAQNCYARGERTLGVMPLYHTMGVRSLLASALTDGCFVCQPRFDAGAALAAIEREGISHLYLVPTLYHDLLSHPAFRREAVRGVRKLGFAGAPMHEALLRRLSESFAPDLLVNHYGSSEIYTFSINQDAAAKPGSAGRAGLNARLRVVSLGCDDPARQAAPGEEGQIIADLAGDEAFEGYHRRPDADARSLRAGWYFTGDTGYFDAGGDLFVTGRVDDMIISGGENISPVDIESVLSLHPAVDEVAVAGLPDERWGQKVVAFVRPRARLDAAILDGHCRASGLANFKRPREYVFVREIPKSPVGKILRRKLVAGEYETLSSSPD